MKIGIMAITGGGRELAAAIAAGLPEATCLDGQGVAVTLAENWRQFDGFLCIMATGIVVRALAPLLADKATDPCVVVMDERGRHVISLLSGHLGGGNDLARRLAAITGGEAVITTASDTLGLVPLDLWAKGQNLAAGKEDMTRAAGLLVNQGLLTLYSTVVVADLPPGLVRVRTIQEADLLISNRTDLGHHPIFHPRNLVVGVGCNRGAPTPEFEEALDALFTELDLAPAAIRNLATIVQKKDEPGLLAFARKRWPLVFFSKDEINTLTHLTTSRAALQAVGAIGVAEPCALLSAGTRNLLSRKRKWRNITMAVAEASFTLSAPVPAP